MCLGNLPELVAIWSRCHYITDQEKYKFVIQVIKNISECHNVM